MNIATRVERALVYIASRSTRIGWGLRISGIVDYEYHQNLSGIVAATESTSPEEAVSILHFLTSEGLLQNVGSNGFALTLNGWRRVEEYKAAPAESAQAFVAMWFSHETKAAYNLGIGPAIEDAGYLPLRIDQKEHVNKIDDEIVMEIRRSKFLVADFTCERGRPRGGVYFEAGLALGLGQQVIWTCRADLIDDVHFDTRQYNHLTWTEPGELRDALRKRIGAVIGDGPHNTPRSS